MLERDSALRGERIHGKFGANSENPGITLQEIKDFSYLEIALWEGIAGPLQTRLGELLGIAALPEPGRMSPLQGGVLLRLEDDRLAYLGAPGAADILAATITAEEGAILDLSHGHCLLRLGGVHAAELLARGIRLDLRPAAFPVKTVVETDIGGLPLLLMRPGAAEYDLLLARSRAIHLWRWLTRRAAQFGYEVRA